MRCAGCGSKVGASVLSRVLARLSPVTNEDVLTGMAAADDASVERVPDGMVTVRTIDGFRPLVDDPYTFGRIVATHSLGDIYAMGAQLSQRLMQTSTKVGHLAFFDVTGRIARTLLDLCKEPDAMTHPDGMQIRITRQEIGRIVGCSREMAGRVLKNLEEQGLINVSGKTIVVFGTR